MYLRIPIEQRALLFAGIPGVFGVVFGAYFVAPFFPPVFVRTSFTVLVSSMGVALLLINQEKTVLRNDRIPIFKAREKSLAEDDSWAAKQDYYYRITKLAIEEASGNTHLLLQMGMSELHARKDPDAALRHFEQATKIDPFRYDAWRSIGIIHKARRAYVPAIKAYSQLPVEGDFGLTRAKALGEIGEAMGALPEARDLYLEALKLAMMNRSLGLESDIEQRLTSIDERMKVSANVVGTQG
jgi:tetratricopeptide (TPR) repeat protein